MVKGRTYELRKGHKKGGRHRGRRVRIREDVVEETVVGARHMVCRVERGKEGGRDVCNSSRYTYQ